MIPRDDATLLERIYARPDDDEPRRAYAARLVERGDPRGELIQLQLAQDPTKTQIWRIAELLEKCPCYGRTPPGLRNRYMAQPRPSRPHRR